MAASNYDVEFPPDSTLGERVLWPLGPAESHGMEDARFVRFTDDAGPVPTTPPTPPSTAAMSRPSCWRPATSGPSGSSQLTGPGGPEQGHGPVPPPDQRPVRGAVPPGPGEQRHRHLRRLPVLGRATTLQSPASPGSCIQIGNCGSPIETPEGWLVLTHGVGPMRVYSIGAILLDLDDPTAGPGPAARAAPGAQRSRAGRLRPQRRVLLRGAPPRRFGRPALRRQRHRHPHRRHQDRRDARTPPRLAR